MTDRLTQAQRSENMRRIRSTDSRPEMVVRRLLHGLGYRYRLHVRSLPGKPDLVFGPRRAIIFIHGCFWHRHPGCPNTSTPASRTEFWLTKFAQNQARDERTVDTLLKLGWRVEVVWECEVRSKMHLTKRLTTFLDAGGL